MAKFFIAALVTGASFDITFRTTPPLAPATGCLTLIAGGVMPATTVPAGDEVRWRALRVVIS